MKTGISDRRLYKLAQELDKPTELYHVTYSGNLPSIAESGLQAAHGEGIGGVAYQSHKEKGIFLTEAEGIDFWFDLSERWSQDRADNPYESELTPVVLQVEIPNPELLIYDEIGSDDANQDAWIYQGSIPPESIYYWDPGIDTEDGPGWYSLDDYADYPIDTSHAYDVQEDPDEGDELYYFKSDSPFKPSF